MRTAEQENIVHCMVNVWTIPIAIQTHTGTALVERLVWMEDAICLVKMMTTVFGVLESVCQRDTAISNAALLKALVPLDGHRVMVVLRLALLHA